MTILNTHRWDGLERQWLASGGPGYSTRIVTTQGGIEQRTQNWFLPRGSWQVGNRTVSQAQYQQILDFFYATRGPLIGFRFRDWTDYKDDGRGVLGSGVGNPASNVYKMNKKREILNQTNLQRITRPIGPTFASDPQLGQTIKLFVDGIQQTFGTITPGTWSIDDSTGICTYNPRALSTIAAAIRDPDNSNRTRITFNSLHSLIVGDGVILSGFTGPSAALNGAYRVHTVISSTILSIEKPDGTQVYAGALTGPQTILESFSSSNVMTWTGEYDYPARFASDDALKGTQIEYYIEAPADFQRDPTNIFVKLPSIEIIELKENIDILTQ